MNEEGFNEAVKEAYTVVFDEMVVRFYSLRGWATTILFMFQSWQCTQIVEEGRGLSSQKVAKTISMGLDDGMGEGSVLQ